MVRCVVLFVAVAATLLQQADGFAHVSTKHSATTTTLQRQPNQRGSYTSDQPISSRDSLLQKGIHKVQVITTLLAGTLAVFGPRLAARAEGTTATSTLSTPAPAVVVEPLGPAPTDFGLIENDYYGDAQKVLAHMRYACQLPKDSPILTEFAGKTKREMVDFVSFYRRFQGISGKQSFSLLYTSINVLAGHYSSYGLRVAVPEKRRKRLLQELNDIEKNIRRQR